MDNFKKRQLYILLSSRTARLQKDLEELMKGMNTAVVEFDDYPEEQQVLLRFEDGVAKTTELFDLMSEDFRLRKELAELKLNIEKLAASGEEEDEEERFYW